MPLMVTRDGRQPIANCNNNEHSRHTTQHKSGSLKKTVIVTLAAAAAGVGNITAKAQSQLIREERKA